MLIKLSTLLATQERIFKCVRACVYVQGHSGFFLGIRPSRTVFNPTKKRLSKNGQKALNEIILENSTVRKPLIATNKENALELNRGGDGFLAFQWHKPLSEWLEYIFYLFGVNLANIMKP